ncbi:hypothetical protein [Moorena sp. SIO3E8]|uniref:hypothetical protein n=1 Tax=Moorena sp. SIO3E8 TaxID=2607830 RepID=UPI0025E2A307|nr:hypothetical protein [Moorena sp. SIO3E8]
MSQRVWSQRVWINGNYIGGSRKTCPFIFRLLSAQKPKLLSFFDRFAGTFFDPKRRKPLYVNALRVNQQALVTTALAVFL